MKVFIAVFFSLVVFSTTSQNTNELAIGDWKGTLSLPGGQSLRLVFHVNENKGKLSSKMDSPDQNAFGLEMDETTFENGIITMTMKQIQGIYKGKFKEGRFEGTWSLSGQEFILNLEKVTEKE